MKYYNYYIFYIFLLIIILTIYFNPFSFITKNNDIFIFFIGLLTVFLCSVLLYLKLNKSDIGYFILKLFFFIFSVFLFIFILFFIINYIIFSNFSLNILFVILNIFILIGALAFGYEFFSKFIEKEISGSGYLILELLLNVIFYIPCLFIDLIKFFKHQLKITTKTVWLILLIEIILILLRILAPYLFKFYKKYISHINSRIIEEGPIYLNNETTVGVFQNLDNIDSKKNYNFAISCKIWINPQPSSTSKAYNKKTLLLNYGDILNIYHYKNKLEIYAATTNDSLNNSNKLIKIYEDNNILYQRWNSIVINYFGGTLDVFINNKLILSEINITPIFFANKIICGSKNGINGGIKSLTFYDKPLSKNDIKYIN